MEFSWKRRLHWGNRAGIFLAMHCWWEWIIKLVIPGILFALVVWSFIDDLNSEDGYMIDQNGQWIITDVLGLSLVVGLFLGAIVLSLWRRKETVENNEVTR